MRRDLLPYRFRLAIAFAASAILTVAAVSAVVYQRAAAHLLAASGSAVERAAEEIAVTLSRDLAARANEVQLLAHTDALRDLKRPDRIRAALEGMQQRLPAYAWIGVTDAQGRVVAATAGLLEGKDISDRPVFRHGAQGFWMGDVHPAKKLAGLLTQPRTGELEFVDIALPLPGPASGPASRPTGVLAVHLYWDWASGVRDQALAAHERNGSIDAFIVSESGATLLAPQRQPDSAGHLHAAARADPSGRWVKARVARDGFVAAASAVDGSGAFGGFGWRVVAHQPLEAALAAAHRLQREIFWLGWACAVVAAALGFALAGRLSAPVSAVVAAARPLRTDGADASDGPAGESLHALAADLRAASSAMERQRAQIVQRTLEARTDTLTGLSNRVAALEHLDRLERELDLATQELCILTLDLDGFKQVNDRLGHAAGDRILHVVAKRLRESLRPGDFVARMGGDEFLIVAVSRRGEACMTAGVVAQRIAQTLSEPVDYAGQPMRVGCSVGAATWPADAGTLDEIRVQSDRAMYAAKRAARTEKRAGAGEASDRQARRAQEAALS